MTLTHTPSEIVARLLVQLGLGADPEAVPLGAWPVYDSDEPDTPDDCVTVFGTAGSDGGRLMPTGEVVTRHGFQVRVRSGGPEAGWQKADAIREALATEVLRTFVSAAPAAYVVHAAVRIGPVLPLGRESPASRRVVFTLNAELVVEQTA